MLCDSPNMWGGGGGMEHNPSIWTSLRNEFKICTALPMRAAMDAATHASTALLEAADVLERVCSHTHTHTQRERERERERCLSGVSICAVWVLCVVCNGLICCIRDVPSSTSAIGVCSDTSRTTPAAVLVMLITSTRSHRHVHHNARMRPPTPRTHTHTHTFKHHVNAHTHTRQYGQSGAAARSETLMWQ